MKYERCPVCEGRGVVYGGFYQNVSGIGLTVSTTEQCRCCQGKGYILASDFAIQLAAANAKLAAAQKELELQVDNAIYFSNREAAERQRAEQAEAQCAYWENKCKELLDGR